MRSAEVVWGSSGEVRWCGGSSGEVRWCQVDLPPSPPAAYTKGGHGNLRGGFSSPAGLLGPPFFKSEAT